MQIWLCIFFLLSTGTAFAETVADKVIIDKSEHLMVVYSGEQQIAQYRVAIGRGESAAKRFVKVISEHLKEAT